MLYILSSVNTMLNYITDLLIKKENIERNGWTDCKRQDKDSKGLQGQKQ